MSKIERFTPEEVDRLRARVEQALEPLAREFNVAFALGRNIRFRAQYCTLPIECAVRIPSGHALTSEALAFVERAGEHGFDPGLLFGQWQTPGGTAMTLIGYDPKRRKAPFVIRDGEGKVFAAERSLIADMAKAPKPAD